MTKKGLSARESFAAVFELIRQKLNCKEITLQGEPWAVIANDSDWHRTKIGYSAYGKTMLATIDGKEWIIALGTACGDYPAEPYNCDIAAIRILSNGMSEKEIQEKIYRELEYNSYFKNSVVIAMADGIIAPNPKGPFREKLLKVLGAGVPPEFIAEQLKFREDALHLDGRPIAKSNKRYTEEFPTYLSDRICEILATCT